MWSEQNVVTHYADAYISVCHKLYSIQADEQWDSWSLAQRPSHIWECRRLVDITKMLNSFGIRDNNSGTSSSTLSPPLPRDSRLMTAKLPDCMINTRWSSSGNHAISVSFVCYPENEITAYYWYPICNFVVTTNCYMLIKVHSV